MKSELTTESLIHPLTAALRGSLPLLLAGTTVGGWIKDFERNVMELEILTKGSARWPEFIKRLDNLLAEWDCDNELTQSREAMAHVSGVDINGTLEYLRSMGGHCDCEVMMNVECGGER